MSVKLNKMPDRHPFMFQTAEGFPPQLVSHFPAGSRSTGSVRPVTLTRYVCCQWCATCPALSSSTSVCQSPSQPTTAVWSSPRRRRRWHTWVRAITVGSAFAAFIDCREIDNQFVLSTVGFFLSTVVKAPHSSYLISL